MYIAKLPLKQWYSAVNSQNSKLLRNHVQIVYWMKEKSFEKLQLLINHIQIVYRMKETSVWELTIVDKSHSLMMCWNVHLMMKMILRICCTNNLSNSVYVQFLYLCTSKFWRTNPFTYWFSTKTTKFIKLMDD